MKCRKYKCISYRREHSDFYLTFSIFYICRKKKLNYKKEFLMDDKKILQEIHPQLSYGRVHSDFYSSFLIYLHLYKEIMNLLEITNVNGCQKIARNSSTAYL